MARRQLHDCRVIVTGASSGIGRQLAIELARHGCRLLLTSRRTDRLQLVKSEIGQPHIYVFPGDLTDPEVRRQLLDTCQQTLGGLDALVNNAGVGAIGRFGDASPQRLRQVMELNFFAPAELIRLAIPLLQAGHNPIIVNVASVLGHRAVPLKSEYCASKFALHGLSDSLRAELSAQGIDVLLVSPSTVDSEFFENVIENQTEGNWKLSSAISAQWLARKIVRAMERGKHEIIVPWSGKCLVWLDRLLPTLANRIIVRMARRG